MRHRPRLLQPTLSVTASQPSNSSAVSSYVLPRVSGRKTNTKMRPNTQTPPYRKKGAARPSCSCRSLNVLVMMNQQRLEVRLAMVWV